MTLDCQCEGAGHCPLLKRLMGKRLHAICQRKAAGMTPQQCDAIRATWLAGAGLDDKSNPRLTGNRVAALTKRLGIAPCGSCNQRQTLLNRAETWLRGKLARVVAVGSLAIVSPYWNPAGYPRLATNYQAFRSLLGDVPFYPAEVSYGGPCVADGLQLRGGPANVLWQKERLINLAVEQLPAKFDRVAFIDGDIVLPDPEWYRAVERALDRWPVVQIGDAIVAGGRQHKMAVAHKFARGTKIGYAWAARRELFPLYDAAVIGGGDMLCAYAWLGRKIRNLTPSPTWVYHYESWAREAHRLVKGKIGHVPGTLVHLDHGSHKGRQYNERYRLVRGLDPESDLTIDESGLWAWTDRGRKFQAALKGFFDRRKDG